MAMKQSKRKRLERAGFRVGTVQEFLQLSDEESALIELKVTLIKMLKAVRASQGITQHQLARLLASSQSRVAKMEAGAADVSLDLICRALFAMGVSQKQIAKGISSRRAA
jgi:DNA-binding XRE family transcriptional regulator